MAEIQWKLNQHKIFWRVQLIGPKDGLALEEVI